MKKWIVLLLVLCLSAGVMGCGKKAQPAQTLPETEPVETTQPAEPERPGTVVGVSLPSSTDKFWVETARAIRQQLEKQGYEMAAFFAEDEVETQQRHLREMLINEVACMVIVPVDSLALLEQEEDAREAGIPVIGLDRQLMHTDGVDVLVTYDYRQMGADVARQIIAEKQLDAADPERRPYTVELFMGTPENHSALLFYTGVMEVLQPYLDSGALECPSGRLDFEDVYVQPATMDQSHLFCADRLEREYTERKLDICFAADDTIAAGCRAALAAAGQTGDKWPLITGQGGDLGSVKTLANGRQTVTVYKDPAALGIACADVAVQLMNGQTVQTDGVTSDNQVRSVPTVMLPYQVITMGNYRQLLVDTGIYDEKEFPVEEPTVPTETTQPVETTQPTT